MVIALFLLVGVSLGLLGGGGSILTVPLLVYVAGLDAKAAVAMSLLVVAITSAFGVLPYVRRRHVDYRVALVFGPVSMAGAFAGGVLAQHFSDTALLVLFALMMLATSIAMLTGRMPRTKASTGEPARGGLLAVEGAVVGLFTGLVGAGGGFLVVPALVLLARLEMRRAIGTSLVIIVLKSSAGLAGHLSHVSFDWTLALTLSLTAAAGAVIGGALAAKVSSCSLRRGFGGLVLAMGLLVLGLQLPAGVLGLLGKHATWFGTGVLLLSGVVLAAWHYIRKHAQGSDTREAPAPSGLPPSAETDLHGGAPGAM